MIVVHPPLNMGLKDEAAEELAGKGLFGDDAASLHAALSHVTKLWAEAEQRARGLDPALLDERVNGEWSFLETIRHLIFATDAWVNGILLGNPPNFHPLGMPPAHAGDAMRDTLTVDARPTLDEVLAVRAERQAMNAAAFAGVTDESMLHSSAGFDGAYTVAAAFQVIVYEEAEHLRFATRDLDRLTGVTA